MNLIIKKNWLSILFILLLFIVSISSSFDAYADHNPDRFVVGDRVKVNIPSSLNVRSTPGGSIIGSVGSGAQGTIVGGPIEVDASGICFWQVAYDSGLTGWSQEGDGLSFYLAKVAVFTPQPTTSPTAGRFVVGDRVRVSIPGSLNVRSSPGGSVIGSVGSTAQGTIVGGPADAFGIRYWQVAYDSGLTGWSQEGDSLAPYLSKIAVFTPAPVCCM